MGKYKKEKLRVKAELKRRLPQKPQKGDYGLIERGNTSHTFTQMVLRDKGAAGINAGKAVVHQVCNIDIILYRTLHTHFISHM